jgi:hypothetical protein|tara:strand:- start:289 stop:621 length:333 start_codon:yes stop_codon:yes gene_type:complete
MIQSITKDKMQLILNQLDVYLCKTALNRRNCGSMAGKLKKDGKPNERLKASELEFYVGAYSCLTFMMAKLENTTQDEAMKYFSPAVMFSGFRGASITDELRVKSDKKAVR